MGEILNDLSPASLVTAIEQNIFAWIPIMAKVGRMSENEPAGVKRSFVDIPYALFNSVLDTQLTPEQVDPAIQVVIADARSRHVPIYWWVTPSAQPANLGNYLEKSGFTLRDYDPGMAVDLSQVKDDHKMMEGFSIQHVDDDASLWKWCRTMSAGFGIPPQAEFLIKAWHDLISQVTQDVIVTFLGWLDGEPVATALLFMAGGVAGIYSIATIPSARRKGIGSWMTLHPLLYARRLGYKAAILEASEMGESVYRKLGFKEYCRVRSYRFSPE